MKNKTIIILAVIAALIVIGSINQSEVPEKGSLDGLDIATFSGGCFWCSESDFEKHEGIIDAISGYAGEQKKTQPTNKFLQEELHIGRGYKFITIQA